ncbi:protein of unknown function [Rhodovastum atsumiense]|nr:protein of unknown function [Rhodovastum atsumiense]
MMVAAHACPAMPKAIRAPSAATKNFMMTITSIRAANECSSFLSYNMTPFATAAIRLIRAAGTLHRRRPAVSGLHGSGSCSGGKVYRWSGQRPACRPHEAGASRISRIVSQAGRLASGA